ncbi:MAG: tRNA (guanine(46)-N(7))-methyltransferase TrmB [Alphaproteobacteria bacterium]
MGTAHHQGRTHPRLQRTLTGASAGAGGAGGRSPIYGRRRGRRLRRGRSELLETLLPEVAVRLPPAPASLDPRGLFARPVGRIWLEIGFGSGEHLAAQAGADDTIGFIGAEPYVGGVAKLLGSIRRMGLDNVRVFADDGRVLLEALASASIARAFLLFPDPWPKKRHHKRRFVTRENLDSLARVLEDGAELRMATDDKGYIGWILERVTRHPAFDWPAAGPSDWRLRPPDWPGTRYEAKAAAEGRSATFLRFRRRSRGG